MISFRIPILLTSIILLLLSFYFAKNFRLDASSDTLILQNDENFQYFEYYNKIFPSKNFLILAVKSNNKIDEDYIKNINSIKNQLNKIDKIDSIFSIVDLPILFLNKLTLSDLKNIEIPNINNSNHKLDQVLDEFAESPIFSNLIINKKKNLSSLIIYLKKNEEYEKIKKLKKNLELNNLNKNEINKKYFQYKQINKNERKKLIKKIRNIINEQNNEYKYYLGGIDMIASDTINFIQKDIIIFSFVVLFFIIIVLFIIYRELKWVIIPLMTSIYSVIIMIGLIGFMSWEITAISGNFILLMLILSISMNIHIINNYRINYRHNSNSNILFITINEMFWPCLYTALTTIVAFGSLLFSNIKPIIDFGYIMIMALLIIFFSSFTILPLIISYFPTIKQNKSLKFSILNNFSNISIKKSNTIISLNIILFIISIFGFYKLNVENSFINYFKSNTEIHQGMKLIDTELGGTTPLDIIINFNDNINVVESDINNENEESLDFEEDLFFEEGLFENEKDQTWFTEEKLSIVKKIHEYLDQKNEIGKVQSLDSLIQMANLINKSDLSIFELSILYKEIPENYKNSLIDPFLSTQNNMVKITARIKDSEKIKRNELIKDINSYIDQNFKEIKDFKVNGLLVLYNDMLQSLFSSQIKSFGIILISIFIMFLILFKSLKLSFFGIIPNIFASSFILGLIGILGIPLDIMTITIAAITIGIAVDNTIHYIYRIKENRKKDNNINNLIENTHANVGYAVLTTSLTIAFGFSVLCLSNFIPTILFGIFTALAMIIAMLGVLLTLPSILSKFKI